MYILYIYIQTTYIHQRRGENRPGEERERRGERREEWRGGERRDLLWVCLYLSFPRGRLWEKHGGRRALSCAKLGWNSTPVRLLLQRVAVTASSSLSGSKSCGRATAPHRASRPLSSDIALPTAAPARRLSWGAGATSTATSTFSGRERGCRRRAA